MGSVKEHKANNNLVIGIMGIVDMFLIGFMFVQSWKYLPSLFLGKGGHTLFNCC